MCQTQKGGGEAALGLPSLPPATVKITYGVALYQLHHLILGFGVYEVEMSDYRVCSRVVFPEVLRKWYIDTTG